MDFFMGIAQTLLVFHDFLIGLVDLEIDRSFRNLNLSGGGGFIMEDVFIWCRSTTQTGCRSLFWLG